MLFNSNILSLLSGLEQKTFDTPWSNAVLEGELKNSDSFIALITVEGRIIELSSAPSESDLSDITASEIVGYLLARWNLAEELIEIMRIGVLSTERRRGSAQALLSDIEERARASQEIKRILLEVSESNRAALALYGKCGYRQIHQRPGYYPDGSAAIVMEKRSV